MLNQTQLLWSEPHHVVSFREVTKTKLPFSKLTMLQILSTVWQKKMSNSTQRKYEERRGELVFWLYILGSCVICLGGSEECCKTLCIQNFTNQTITVHFFIPSKLEFLFLTFWVPKCQLLVQNVNNTVIQIRIWNFETSRLRVYNFNFRSSNVAEI